LRGPTFLDGPEGGQVLPAVPQALPCGRGYAALEKHGTVESRMIATRPRRQRQSTGIRARCLGACGSPARRPVNIDFLAMSRPLSFYAAISLTAHLYTPSYVPRQHRRSGSADSDLEKSTSSSRRYCLHPGQLYSASPPAHESQSTSGGWSLAPQQLHSTSILFLRSNG
jgi:hypothetical protein